MNKNNIQEIFNDSMAVKENRFDKLREDISDYTNIKNSISTGFESYSRIKAQKKKIMDYLDASDEDWNDYSWQMKNRFVSADDIAEIIDVSEKEKEEISIVSQQYRFAVSPYYLSLIDPGNPSCPIKKQSIPSIKELDDDGELDPMNERGCSIEDIITRRYPDRLIIKVTNICGMFCRFCQRRRLIGEFDTSEAKEKLLKAVRYVKENREIRDVLITGGDAFMLPDSVIDWLLSELRDIEHVEIIRFGTRTPVTLPQRITKDLTKILKKYHPVYVNTHFNHPGEITPDSAKACAMLADAGIPLGNQMVLLNGINNDKYIVRRLNQSLLKMRVKPYYIFHPKKVKGTKEFWVGIEEGLGIMESLRGRTSGLAIPTYIVNGPGGLGKTPILPNYMLYMTGEKAVFRNWQGQIFDIDN